MWDIKIRVDPDGVCGDSPIQFYARPGEEPEPQGRVEVQGSTVWMWFFGLSKPSQLAAAEETEEIMVAFSVEYLPPELNGWTMCERRTRMTPVAASRMFQGSRLYTDDKREVLLALMGNYSVLDAL